MTAAAAGDAELHKRAVVVDTHADTTQKITYQHLDAAKLQPTLHLDLPKMQKGGLDAQFFSIWVDPTSTPRERWFAAAEEQFAAVHKLIRDNPQTIAWAKTAADIRNNAAHGKLSALFGVEGAHALLPGDEATQLSRVRRFYDEGARYMTLTWSNSNALGGSSGDDGKTKGLTDFGRRVIDEMHKLGMMVDISHVSDPMFWDVIAYVKKPVIASHSSSRALATHPRNLTDEMLRAIAKNRGAACVNYNPRFLDYQYARDTDVLYDKTHGMSSLEQEKAILLELPKYKPVPLERLVEHIDHMVKVAGVDHVCLGSDFDGIIPVPLGLEDVSKLPALTAALHKRGYADADILKILGGNTLRVLETNEVKKR
jgi:membrane dipeptidase